MPGRYRVRLSVGAKSEVASLDVLMDPRLTRVQVTVQDLREQYDLLVRIKDAISRVQRAADAIRKERARLQQSGVPPSSDPMSQLATLENQLVGAPGRERNFAFGGGAQPLVAELTSLYTFVGESEDKPTAAASARWNDLQRTLDERISRANALVR